jgi:pyruvate/2-oxoglutarate/acetoin dehydrogenase E1 component
VPFACPKPLVPLDNGIDVEVVDVRTLKPLDEPTILESVCRTRRLIVADAAWRTCGFAAEIIALAAEKALDSLKCPPERVT